MIKSWTMEDVREEYDYIAGITRTELDDVTFIHKSRDPKGYRKMGVINKKTFQTALKIYTRKNDIEISEKYTTYFPALKYYSAVRRFVHAIRVNDKCKRHDGNYYFVYDEYKGPNGERYPIIIIHPDRKNKNKVGGLSTLFTDTMLIRLASCR